MGIKETLSLDVRKIYNESWNRRDGRKIPTDADIAGGNVAVDLDACILYADLDDSTQLVDNFKDWFAAKQYKTFLQCVTKLIRSEGGEIRSFDGDRAMGIFIGVDKEVYAVRCGLKINWAVKHIIQPALKAQYENTKYVMQHVVGIDSSNIMAAKAGIRNSNDIVWIGRAANHAAKLTNLPSEHPTWITEAVYNKLNDNTKFSSNRVNMWEQRQWTAQNNRRIYRSKYWWPL